MKRAMHLAVVGSIIMLSICFGLSSSVALAEDRYVDDDDVTCGGNYPCYSHPQDAVNSATAGDTIIVYPGTYDSRQYTSNPPHWSPNDQWAPALIVYRDSLTIQAVDPNPANTTIQTTHDLWSNSVAIQASTGGTWDGSQYVGAGVNPTGGTSPNGVIVIANGVTIEGFTIISTYGGDPGYPGANPNTAGVFIGGLYAGDRDRYGISGTAVRNCIISGHSGVRLWKAPDTTIEGNTVDNNQTLVSPGTTPIGAGISVWDGWCDNPNYPVGGGWCEGPNVGSAGLQIIGNDVTTYFGAQGIALGGYYDDDGDAQMDHSNLFIHDNTIDSSGHGVTFWGSGGINKFMTCINTVLVPAGYDQVAVWWGTYDGPFGINCEDQFVTGGGWIDSPSGAYMLHDMDVETDVFLNGFESDTSGWFPYSGTITRVPSGTSGVTSADGNWHAEIGVGPNNGDGAYTNFGGYSSAFPTGGFSQLVDVYIDPTMGSIGNGWALDNALNGSDGVWEEAGGVGALKATDGNWWVAADGDGGGYPGPASGGVGLMISTAGWYTIESQWVENSDDPSEIDRNTFIYDSNGTLLYSNLNLKQVPLAEAGGNRYGWFLDSNGPDWPPIQFPLPIDNSRLRQFVGPTGKANFAFISRYKKNDNLPTGQTLFIFKAADLNFHSDSYDWLVVTGSDYAKFKGTGTINGAGNYKFKVWAGDGDPDTFRIKIWEEDGNGTETVIYDNGTDQAIGGGSVVVHKGKK